jgi:hypothetical protein
MAKLTAKQRKKLPASAFAYPAKRKYPIDTPARARNALARAAQRKTYGNYATVAAKVKARYPSIGKKKSKRKVRRRG